MQNALRFFIILVPDIIKHLHYQATPPDSPLQHLSHTLLHDNRNRKSHHKRFFFQPAYLLFFSPWIIFTLICLCPRRIVHTIRHMNPLTIYQVSPSVSISLRRTIYCFLFFFLESPKYTHTISNVETIKLLFDLPISV